MDLTQRWIQVWSDLDLQNPDSQLLQALLDRYSESHRAYHTPHHLEHCFNEFDGVRGLCGHAGEVQLALWFHDAIYNTRASDNEDQSASWADRVLEAANAPLAARHRIRDLIMSTRHNVLPSTNDARLVVDIDLAILGAASALFDQYEGQIRFEYSWVPDAAFREGRCRILEQFLKRPSIYFTSHFHNRFEQQARTNLERSLTQLTAIDQK